MDLDQDSRNRRFQFFKKMFSNSNYGALDSFLYFPVTLTINDTILSALGFRKMPTMNNVQYTETWTALSLFNIVNLMQIRFLTLKNEYHSNKNKRSILTWSYSYGTVNYWGPFGLVEANSRERIIKSGRDF